MQLSRQRRREIEAETVDVHLGDPVTQRIHQQLQHARVLHVERVPGAREIEVVARIVALETVVGAVIDAAEAQRRPHLVALGGVVIDDVENDFEPGGVQRLHHRLELVYLAGGRVARLRCKEADAVVSPVIAQSLFDQQTIVYKGVHWHQLKGGDA